MNILYISPNFNHTCGVSKHVFELMKNCRERYAVNVYFITNGGDALPKLFDIGIHPFFMNFKRGLTNVFFIPSNLLELNKYCIQHDIDIIHTHHRYPELLSVILSQKLKLKTITTAHSFVEEFKQFSFRSDKIVAVSNAVRNSLIQYFNVPDEKIITLHNCQQDWEMPNYQKIKKLKHDININEKDIVLLFLGRINRIKGIDLLITAFRKIKLIYPNAKLLMVGEILDKTYKQMEVKINDDITHLAPAAETNLFYEISDLVIVPSRVETLSYVMLESGIACKPFIGSRTGGMAEFIEDEINGFLFKPECVDDFVKKIKFVLENPKEAKSAAEKLYKKVKKYCNCEKYYENIFNIYVQLLAK